MFVGHYGPSFAIKSTQRSIPCGRYSSPCNFWMWAGQFLSFWE